MRRDPVDAGAFHRHRFYLSLFEPLRHPHQFWRCCSEIRHFSTASLQPWRAHPVPLTADINSRYLGAYYGQPCNGPRTAGTIPTLPVIPHPRSTFPNTTAQVGRYAESALATFRRKNRSCVFFDGARPICDRRVAVRIGGL